MAPALEVSGLTKVYPAAPGLRPWRPRGGPRPALREVSFSVARGRAAALLGPNGAGKTTLLKILSTVLLPDGGAARILGRDVVAEAAAIRTLVGWVTTEDRSFYWRLSPRENLAFFAALQGEDRRRALAEADRLLELVGLAADSRRPVMELSGGLRRRLGIARALLGEPPVLLLDEPTRSLDPEAGRGLEAELRRLAAERGLTLLFATHDLEQARRLADTALVLRQGRLAGEVPAPGRRAWRIVRGGDGGPPFPEDPALEVDPSGRGATFRGGPGGLAAYLVRLAAAGVAVAELAERADDGLEHLLGVAR